MVLALVVDDACVERRRVREVVLGQGWAFSEAADGVEALLLIESLRPSCLITDLAMPRMDGLALLRELIARHIDIPTIVITSDRQHETQARCRHLGAIDVLPKPWEPARLIDLLANVRQMLTNAGDDA